MTQFFNLSQAEAEATRSALDTLRGVSWAAQLVARIAKTGGLSTDNMASLFEGRFGLALHDRGITPEYEHAAGVGNTTVDFRFGHWLVELYSLDESDALKAATWQEGPVSGRFLVTYQPPSPGEIEEADQKRERDLAMLDASSEHDALKQAIRREIVAEAHQERQRLERLAKQSPAGEVVKAIERMVRKAAQAGQPAKFPSPDGSRFSMLVVDARAFGVMGADRIDGHLIAYGANAVPECIESRFVTGDGRQHPIRGAFDPGNPTKAARHFRERVHFLGIVSEKTYERDELHHSIRFYPNLNLFPSEEAALAVLATFPLTEPSKEREQRPELFLDEMTRIVSEDEIEFGILVDQKSVVARVHRDTLEDIEKRSLTRGSSEILRAFERRKHSLRQLAFQKQRRGQVERNGAVFLRPADLADLR
ncbi:DUF1488 family protein [Bradyrhizobium prioriisuperbiae]|uniref:DUF1488 family protein n=1 Tax=Bradyrhizobium prioriisuperbiae TaxID=2854389 RepID=UPI0028E455D3|nr:DUF1488 family protein [Bradyrhizobium prioritasuperba]